MNRFNLPAVIGFLLGATLSNPAFGIFVDGHGYYGLRGETQTKPDFLSGSSSHQAIDEFFRLDSELRVNDKSSMFLEFKVFDDERSSYLGDSAAGQSCPSGAKNSSEADCRINGQNSAEPRYKAYTPKVNKIYARYAMDYCLLSIGRRGRSWGMGVFLDDGSKPFSTDSSIFDGITCDINIQKSQNLGFSVGYDKLSETGANPSIGTTTSDEYGGTNNGDDLDQFFFTIEFNDHRTNLGKGLSKQIGIYFANIVGGKDTDTDLKLADLYLNFIFQDLIFQNEILFRLGRSGDPNWATMGAARTRDLEDRVSNELQSIGLAGSFEYFISRSGAYLGPKEYNQGNASSHSIFLGYAYAPGDSDGYNVEYPSDDAPSSRDRKVTAMAFHKNYKPALLLFNGRKSTDKLKIDGVFDPFRLVNVTVFESGYRYNSVENGNFEAKVVSASLNETAPSELAAAGGQGIGYHGNKLGVELDFQYSKKLGKEFELGFAAAVGSPGSAWKLKNSDKLENNYLLQTYATLFF